MPMPNVAVVWPAGIVTLAGTVTSGLLLSNRTMAPPAAAGPLSDTVPATLARLEAVAPESAKEASVGAWTCRAADAPHAVLAAALIVADTAAGVGVVVIAKLAAVWPAAIFTKFGTCTKGLLLSRLTGAPPAGAGAVKLTAPFIPMPPTTVPAASVTASTQGSVVVGTAVMVADAAPHMPADAEMVACTALLTAPAFTVKVATARPAGTTTSPVT